MVEGSSRSSGIRRGLFGIILLGFGSAVPLAASPAAAADYVDVFNISVDSLNCRFAVNVQSCDIFVPFQGGPRVAQVGDTFTATINLDETMTVPASTGGSAMNTVLVDATSFPGGLAAGPYAAVAELTLEGYDGAPLTLSGPLTLDGNFGYPAFAGICCGPATDPYSFTGAEATYHITGEGPLPIQGLAFGYLSIIDYTPQVLSDFLGGHPDAPVLLPAGLVGEISGNIGGDYPPYSFFGFDWQGGLFQTDATIFGASSDMLFNFKLFDSGNNLVQSLALTGGDFSGRMTIGSLAAGRYKIGLASSEIPDPAFTIRFNTPVGTSGVPEPSTWAMMLLGFGFVGAAMRSRRRLKAAVAFS